MHAEPLVPPLDPDASGAALLARRLRIAVTLCIAPIILFALFDLRLLQRDELALYWSMKLAALAVIGWSLSALRGPRTRRQVVFVGLTCIAAMYALSTASALMAGEGQTTMLLTLAVALAAATLLPWGVGPQVVVVAIATLSTVATMVLAEGSIDNLLRYPVLGLAIGLGASIYVAAEFEASRQALARRQAEQRRAEQEVRRLNEQLEARVIERTAELERVNQALQAEIGERARTLDELRQSEAAATAVIENADDAIWSIDRELNLTACNAVVRRRFAAAHGVAMPDQLAAFPPAARREFEEFWAPLYQRGLAGERFEVAHSSQQPSGTRYFVTSFNPIVRAGVVTGLAIFSSDVSERHRAEEAARQHQAELTHVLRLSTMGEMAAGLAHEINQPLAAIVNYATGSARRLRDRPHDVAAVLPVIDSIAAEALRAGEIIRRLRHLIRKDATRQDWVDLNEVATEALRIVEPEARQQSVEVACELADALPRVLGDAIQIEQVVLNLLRNAIEAMAASNGTRRLRITTRALPGDEVELSVRDSGPGLPPDVADHVFEPFFSTKPTGLGMGLSISRTIAESHNGRLWAIANPDGGATFRLRLPLGQRPVMAQVASSR
ncbi:MAG: ATP-binding protein [Deltaproteobacteria bacterium]|nr:ATP-binding protein [Deltaproteobacteria bacterium]